MRNYRGLLLPEPGLYPFWFWNGTQEESEIERQLELFRLCGCKGVVIHSRIGNKIPYLSERWLELVRCACAKAKKLGLVIWLYDEDGYPSGNAGNQIPKLRPELIQKTIWFKYEGTDPDRPAFAAFDPATWRMIDEKTVPAGTDALRFTMKELYHVDTMNPEAGKLFIEFTHEKYAAALAEYFGNVIQAVYTDDESIECCLKDAFPWSPVLAEEYRKRFGRDVRELFPFLVEDLPGSPRARLDYFGLAQELFLKNFIRPQNDWSERHGLVYTGHLCCDEGPYSVFIRSFVSAMPYMKLETVPAIDDFLIDMVDQRYLYHTFSFGENRTHNKSDILRFPLVLYKFASSVAHQFAHDIFSAEVLTFLSWRCTPRFMDKQMLFEAAAGVNLITPHGFYYTMGGNTCHDCPPSYFFQQPFFPFASAMFSKWTHAAELLLRGKFRADLLVIHPKNIVSLENGLMIDPHFTPRTKLATPALADFERDFCDTVRKLHALHVGFDFGDEDIMASGAKVENGRIVIGDMSYSAVLLPPRVKVTEQTKSLLEKFAAQGGKILATDEIAALEANLAIAGDGSDEIMLHSRINNGKTEFFLVNLAGRDLKPEIVLAEPYSVYDPASKKIVFTGNALPRGFTFPDGAAFFLFPQGSFNAPELPFERSAFAPLENRLPAGPVMIHALDPNIFAVPHAKNVEFELAPGTMVCALFAEDIFESGIKINGTVPVWKKIPCHPADPCYLGADATGLFHEGINTVSADKELPVLYISGMFRVEHDARLAAPLELNTGDLSAQGYPFYWGALRYDFTFVGRKKRLKADFSCGALKIAVNGKDAGFLFSPSHTIDIAELCKDGTNLLSVELRNIAANFIDTDPVPFGLDGVTVL